MSFGFLHAAAEVSYPRYVRVTRLKPPYLEAVQLVEKVNEEAASDDSAAGNGGLRITHLDGALLLKSENWKALLLNNAAAVVAKNGTNETRIAAPFKALLSISMPLRFWTGWKTSKRGPFERASRLLKSFFRLRCHGRGYPRCL